ncbi:MAG: glycosyltransferase family 39 protein [bacterium]
MKKAKKPTIKVKEAVPAEDVILKNALLQNAPKPSTSLLKKTLIKVFSRSTYLVTLLIVMFFAVFATMRDSQAQKTEEAFLNIIKAPFYQIHISYLQMGYTPYFLINLVVILICLLLIFSIFKKREGKVLNTSKTPWGSWFFLLIAIISYLFQIKLFMSDKLYVVQGLLYLTMIIIFAVYLYRVDVKNGVAIITHKLLQPAEQRNLLIFSGIMFIVYIFDYNSWKYSFIGDEYMFYDFAVDIAKGLRPLQFFYESGVAGDHPILASIYPAAIMKIFGTGLLGWKINAALVPALTIIPLYMWMKMIFKRKVAIITVVAFAFSAAMMAFSHIAHDVVHAVFPFVLALLVLELAIRKNSKFWSFVTGLVLALGCYSFYTARLTVLVAALYWLFHPLRRKYAISNLFTGLSIYAASIVFVLLNPDFIKHMTVHSVFTGSEVSNISERPLYMIMNYITTFFAFLFKPNMSHFIAGSTAEWLTATGAIAGLIWCVLSLKKDWRARWLLSSYAVLVLFIGGIVQYTYAPNTRVNFLAPMFSILAGVGLMRLLAASAIFIKMSYKKYIVVFFSVVVLIMLNGVWYFYFYFPKAFFHTQESYIVKYMQEKANPHKTYLMVTGQFIRDTHLPELYKFPKGFACMGVPAFEKMLKDNSAAGKVFLFSVENFKAKPDLRAIVEKGSVIYNYELLPVAYVFDFTNENYYKGFKQLWLTGKTFLSIEEPDLPPMTINGTEKISESSIGVIDTVKLKKNIKSNFTTGMFFKNSSATTIEKYKINKLNLNEKLGISSDMAISEDGIKLYIADGGAKLLKLFTRISENNYQFKKIIKFYPEQKKFLGIFDTPKNKLECFMYVCLDNVSGDIYALDSDTGAVRVFDSEGVFKSEIIRGSYLIGARSLRISDSGIILTTAVPAQNMVLVFTNTGKLVNNLVTTSGNGLGQLAQPSFAITGMERGIYVVDAKNGRVQHLDDSFNFIEYYRLGDVSVDYGPQLLIYDNEKVPYFMIMQPHYQRLLLYPIHENRIRLLDLKGIKGINLKEPSIMTKDKAGSIYLLDAITGIILKIELPEDVITAPPIYIGRRS